MNRYIPVVVIVVLAILGVGGYFGIKSSIGKESGPPTESEVSALIKSAYESCIPRKEWEAKIISLRAQLYGEKPTCVSGWSSEDCEDWIKGKYECGVGTRNVEADHFVSFKKTDGTFNGGQNHYTMYGVVTRFDSTTGKEYEYSIDKYGLSFERRETGWVLGGFGLWYPYAGPELKIPR